MRGAENAELMHASSFADQHAILREKETLDCRTAIVEFKKKSSFFLEFDVCVTLDIPFKYLRMAIPVT
jgi:hypothetical protein